MEDSARQQAQEEDAPMEVDDSAERAAEEERLRLEEESRLQAEQAALLKAEEEARLKAEEESRLRAEEESRLKAEEDARLKAEEERRQKAEAEAVQRAEEERVKAEEEARQRALVEEQERQRALAEELERQRLEQEKLRAEEQARHHAEQERLRAEEESRLRAEKEESARLEEVARQKAEQERIAEEKRVMAEQNEAEEQARREEQDFEEETSLPEEVEMQSEEQPKKSLFKHQIAPPALIASLAGPPPTSDDLESASNKGPVPLMSLEVEPPEEGEEKVQQDLRLPKALEEALAFKSEWANQIGVSQSEIARVESEGVPLGAKSEEPSPVIKTVQKPVQLVEGMDDDDEKSKGKKKNKKKKKKKNRPEEWARQAAEAERRRIEAEEAAAQKEATKDVEIEYIQEKLELDMSDPMYRQFSRIFEAFKIKDADEVAPTDTKKPDLGVHNEELKKVPKLLEADDMIEEKEDEETDGASKLSKRKMKKLNRLSVAELKQLVSRPDVVEMHDVTAKDPGLLVHLKSIRNSVPVPRHWCFKRKYLQGKRGIEKPPFDLPEFIKKTGIMEMRAALQEKEEAKNMKTKMREKVRPKLGKIDIDYQKLHDAFFKWQTKPRMTYHGDLYYEGKEFEIRLKEKKPGDLSDDLRTALGMPVGPNAHKVPPPWLISMQRYGPPPSYPNLKIPGLNAPIPDGCSFGYHAGGWGKPPVDETGKPLYGDVFGTSDSSYSQQMPVEEVDQTLWGEMESESEEEESEEEEEEEEEDGEQPVDTSGMQTPIVGDAGMQTPSGLSSVGAPPGQETPELIELRKRKIEADMEGGETPNLYTILPERQNQRIGAGMMGSTHTYDLPSSKRLDTGAVEMALNPDEVDLIDSDAMQAKAEAALREKQASLAKEDLSDMVAEHAAKQAGKRKRQAGKEDTKSNKKYKEFKF